MRIRFGVDGKAVGEAWAQPDGTIAYGGPGADSIKETVRIYAQNLMEDRGPNAGEITADDVLAYVVQKMRGKRSWAEEVKIPEGVP